MTELEPAFVVGHIAYSSDEDSVVHAAVQLNDSDTPSGDRLSTIHQSTDDIRSASKVDLQWFTSRFASLLGSVT